MNRREALLGAIILVGGPLLSVALPAGAYSGTVVPAGTAGRFFTASEMASLAAVAETMIPATTTPGAMDANVHGVIDGLMLDWALPSSQAQFRAALAHIDRTAGPAGFPGLMVAERLTLLTRIDTDAFLGQGPEHQAYRRLKQLIYLAYFTSKGADPDYVLVPGAYHGDLSQAQLRDLVREHA